MSFAKIFRNTSRYFRVVCKASYNDNTAYINMPVITDGSYPNLEEITDEVYKSFNSKGLFNKGDVAVFDVYELPKADFDDFFRKKEKE